jgi:hypothetical protein
MMMDDVGNLIWRFSKQLVTANKADDQPEDHKPPPAVLHSPAAE